MKISLIIPCYNAADTLADQLEAILDQPADFPFEIIVADNRSTDHSREVVCSFVDRYPQVKLVDAVEKQGPGYARNVGCRHATGDILVFCDADDVVGRDWLPKIVAGLADADLAIGRIEHKRLNKDSWLAEFSIDSNNFEDDDLEVEDHRAPFPPYLMMVRGWGFAIRREIHEKIEGFDEELMAAEDIDYGFRAQLAGATVNFVQDAVLHYRLRPTTEKMKAQWYNYGYFTALMRKRYSDDPIYGDFVSKWLKHILGWVQLLIWRIRIKELWEVGLFTRNLAFRRGILAGSIKFRVPPMD